MLSAPFFGQNAHPASTSSTGHKLHFGVIHSFETNVNIKVPWLHFLLVPITQTDQLTLCYPGLLSQWVIFAPFSPAILDSLTFTGPCGSYGTQEGNNNNNNENVFSAYPVTNCPRRFTITLSAYLSLSLY